MADEESYSSGEAESMFFCSLCTEKYGKNRKPKLLPCCHTFCQVCIKNWSRKNQKGLIDCPECREEHAVPTGGVDQLQNDLTMIKFMEQAYTKRHQQAASSKTKESNTDPPQISSQGATRTPHHVIQHLLSTLKDSSKDIAQSGKVFENVISTIRSERDELYTTFQKTTTTINSAHDGIVKTAAKRKNQLMEELNKIYEENLALLNAQQDEYSKKKELHEQFCSELSKDLGRFNTSDVVPTCEDLETLIKETQSKDRSLHHEFQISLKKISYNNDSYGSILSSIKSWGVLNQDHRILKVPPTCLETGSSLVTTDRDQDSLNFYVAKDKVIRTYGHESGTLLNSPCCVTQLPNQDIAIATAMSYKISIFSSPQDKRILPLTVTQTVKFDRGITGMCMHPSGKLCISNPDQSEVQILALNGTPLYNIKVPRTIGEGKFDPGGIVCSPTGDLYVCDRANHLVRVFNDNFKMVKRFGGRGKEPGKFNYPSDVALMPDGEIAVADYMNDRIQVFDGKTYIFKRTIATSGGNTGQLKGPIGITIDSHGFMVVSEQFNNRVQLFTPGGKPYKTLGTLEGPNQLDTPKGIAITTAREILVCDSKNDRVQVY